MDDTTFTSALDTDTEAALRPVRRIEVLNEMAGRRRIWTLEEKLALVAEMERCGNIAALSRERDVSTCGLPQRDGQVIAMADAPTDPPLAFEFPSQPPIFGVLRRPVESAQFSSMAFTGVLLREKIAISMDDRGAWRDNVVVERLWRSVKYEEVYLKAYGPVSEAGAGIGRYLRFYNEKRPHSSLGARTPDQTYFDNLPATMAV